MNALEIRNLTKSYPGFTLDNINLTLPIGCIMGLIGENGAGKSTTINLNFARSGSKSGRMVRDLLFRILCSILSDTPAPLTSWY